MDRMSGDHPTRIGRYTIDRKLGDGGMGDVFLGYSPAGSPVAVKLIRADKLDPHTRARFEREAKIARTIVGTNRVARFLEADPYAERPWLAMEYVPGLTLLQYVQKYGVLEARLVASLGALLAEGLQAVHASGLLHRDLKPQNIILGSEGPIIIDFGLSAFVDASQDSLSHRGMIIGTVRCMPPEQADGNPKVTAAADVYALGTVLLYAATGHYPYEGTSWKAIVTHIVNPRVAPNLVGTPDNIVALIGSMLSYEATDRPPLPEVAEACAEILVAEKTTPAQARLALIACTAEGDVPHPKSPAPSHSVAVVLGDLPPSADDDGGPLDAPPPVETESAEPDVATPSVSPGPSERAGRVPASQRVADELRTQYARKPSL
jgi:serine/threonine protein kinase